MCLPEGWENGGCSLLNELLPNDLGWMARSHLGKVLQVWPGSLFLLMLGMGAWESCHVQGLCCGVSVSPLTPLSPPPNHNTGRAHGGTCPDARVHFLGLLVGALGQLQAGLGWGKGVRLYCPETLFKSHWINYYWINYYWIPKASWIGAKGMQVVGQTCICSRNRRWTLAG